MKEDIFRKKSIERISSPDDLTTYIHVARAEGWIVLIAVMIILFGLIGWSYFSSINSYIYGKAEVSEGVVTATFEDSVAARNLTMDMNLEIGDFLVPIGFVKQDEYGNIIAVANVDIPDGSYDVKASYKETQLISLLFN
ncbi:hypothetical protein SAMN04487928_10589 [Butyrivibrio proteoclasticus]|uniref:Uncharacterized protein n=2 Tax=Butyrivibrio proteoclasticus TaxID=43305 RepID=A0A1I5S2G0_9FIRM|nr:hypothetical protein SAMN04487928_10589 [Butyrivibrio proteoclasticus]